jgi:hypothetical protein
VSLPRSPAGNLSAVLLREVSSFAGGGESELVFDLGGNVAEWIVWADGKGRLAGGSADRSKELSNREQQAGAAYSGFRVLKE